MWVNPNPPKEDAGDEEDEEEEKAEVQPEVGPPLLQPLQNDDRESICSLVSNRLTC